MIGLRDHNCVEMRAPNCLVLIDLQNDFMPSGALAVPRGDEIIPVVNRLVEMFEHVIATQDWHPPHHCSFASQHPGAPVFGEITLPYGTQRLWPEHCVQGTHGAQFHPMIAVDAAEMIVRKGYRRHLDSYSAFRENDRNTCTGLAGALRERGLTRLFFVGLATDFCVRWSIEDARASGFDAVLIEDACRAIDVDGSLAGALKAIEACGAQIASSTTISSYTR